MMNDDGDIQVFRWAIPAFWASTSISCVCSLFVIISCSLFPILRQRAFRLAMWISLSDLGANLTSLMDFVPCTTQAFFKQFFATAAVIWPVMIALTMYSAVMLRGIQGNQDSSHYLAVFLESDLKSHTFVWGISALAAILPLATDSYGPAGGLFCWIEDTDDLQNYPTLWRFTTLYALLWMGFVISCSCYYAVYQALRGIVLVDDAVELSQNHQTIIRVMRTLKFYPVVFCVSWLPSSIYRVIESLNPHEVEGNKVLSSTFFVLYGPAVQGILTGVAFGTTPAVGTCWRHFFLTGNHIEPGAIKPADADRADVDFVDCSSMSSSDTGRSFVNGSFLWATTNGVQNAVRTPLLVKPDAET